MRFVRILSLVLLVVFCAVMARADGTTTDPIYKFDDPCSAGPDCLVFTYTGPTGPVGILTFFTSSPATDPWEADTSCNAFPPFLACEVLQGPTSSLPGSFPFINFPTGFVCPADEFCGVSFQLGFLTHDEQFALQLFNPQDPNCIPTAANDYCGLPPIPAVITPAFVATTPEPNTGVLFASGLLLVFLGGFARKRFGAGLGTSAD